MRKKPPPRRKPRRGSFSEGQGQMPLPARCCSFRPHSRTSRRGGVLPRPRGTMLRYGCTDANTHAPVGADASVRPAVCTREHARTNANPYNICRGRCPHRPARRTSVFTIRCGKFAIAPRADRGVRPYKTLCGFAENARNFAIACCRGERGIDPYGRITLLPFGCAIL